MRCSRVRKLIVGFEDGKMPAVVAAHIEACAECRAFAESNKALGSLVALKRYEKPDAGFEARNLRAIQQRIVDENLTAVSERPWVFGIPALRYAVVAAFLVLIAVFSLVSPPLGVLQPEGGPVSLSKQRAASGPMDLASTQLTPSAVMTIASNGIQYGTTPSALTGFEY